MENMELKDFVKCNDNCKFNMKGHVIFRDPISIRRKKMLDSDVLLTVALILLAISSVLNFIGRTSGKNDDKNDVTDFDTYINWLEQIGVPYTINKEMCYDVSYKTYDTSTMPERINYHVVFDYDGSRIRDYVD